MTRQILWCAVILALLTSIGCSSSKPESASSTPGAAMEKKPEASQPQPAAGSLANRTPCQLVAKADVEQAIGMAAADPKPNRINPKVCDFKVGDSGNISFMAQPAAAGQTQERMMEESRKQNLNPVEAPGIGDFSFFASPGYGMIQLNSFKGSDYIIITMLVPNVPVEKQKAAAEQLMKKALSNL